MSSLESVSLSVKRRPLAPADAAARSAGPSAVPPAASRRDMPLEAVRRAATQPEQEPLSDEAAVSKPRSVGVLIVLLGGGVTALWLSLLSYWAASLLGRLTGLF